MALIQRGMYEQYAARHLAVKGPGALTNLEEGVMGTLPLDLSSPPIYWFLQGFRTFGRTIQSTAAAGEFSWAGIAFEDTTEEILGQIIMIDQSLAAPGATYDYQIARALRTDLSSDPGIYGRPTDTRVDAAQPSSAVGIAGRDAAPPVTVIANFSATNDPDLITKHIPLIVSPGQCIVVVCNTANTEIKPTFIWVEAPAYKAEL
mgnify:CR=1 FL=1